MNTKRILAILLSILMLITVATTAILAEEDKQNDPFDADKWGGVEGTTVTTEATSATDVTEPDSTEAEPTESTIPSSTGTEATEPDTTESSSSESESTTPSSSETESTTPSSSTQVQPTGSTTQPTSSTQATEPTGSTTQPTGSTQATQPTGSVVIPNQSTTETNKPTSALDPSNPDAERPSEVYVTVKNEAGEALENNEEIYVGLNKAGERTFSYSYIVSPAAKVVWESDDTSKLQVLSDNGETLKIKVVSKNPVKDFTDYVTLKCKYDDKVIFELNIIYLQLNSVKKVKTSGTQLVWGKVEFAKGYVVYDLTAKTEKTVTKNKFKAKPGHQYQVQAFEKSFGVNYYSAKSAKVFCFKAPTVKFKAGKKLIKVTSKKIKNADRFQVKFKTGKSKWTTKTYKTKKALNAKINNLKSGKTYKLQVRVCKGTTSLSNWSAVKKIKVK